VASGLSAHLFAAVVSIGSSSSQNKHFNSVRPLGLGVDTILFPQCKQRHPVHCVSSVSSLPLRRNAGTELSFLHFYLHL
jgi:hypothetical protein